MCWAPHWDRSWNTSIPQTPGGLSENTRTRKDFLKIATLSKQLASFCLAFASASPFKNRRWKKVIFPRIAMVLQNCIWNSSRDTCKIEGAGRGHQDKPQITISNARPSKSCGWISKSDPCWKRKLSSLYDCINFLNSLFKTFTLLLRVRYQLGAEGRIFQTKTL